jgi:RNA polymerase sigma-70 factor, ECF subfamily
MRETDGRNRAPAASHLRILSEAGDVAGHALSAANGSAGVTSERPTTGDLLAACRRGDPAALRALYEAHKDRVYSLALHFFQGDAATAADVTQQVFVKVLARMDQYRHEAEFSTWLYRVTANACIDEQRKARKVLPLDRLSENAPALRGERGDDERLVRDELAAEVKAAVASLSPKLRIAVLLRYFDDRPYEEIAASLGVSPGTVASRLNRAHQALARRLAHLRDAVL